MDQVRRRHLDAMLRKVALKALLFIIRLNKHLRPNPTDNGKALRTLRGNQGMIQVLF